MTQDALVEQVVSCRDVIVPICFDALYRVVRIEAKLIENLLIYAIFHRHQLVSREQAHRLLVPKLAIPRVLADLCDPVALVWIGLQDLGQEVRAVSGEKAR